MIVRMGEQERAKVDGDGQEVRQSDWLKVNSYFSSLQVGAGLIIWFLSYVILARVCVCVCVCVCV